MLKRQINVWRRIVCMHIGISSRYCACGDRYGLRLLKPSGFGKWYYPFLDVNTRRCFIAEWSWQSFLMRFILAPKHPFIQPKQILIGRQRWYVMRENFAVSSINYTFFNCVSFHEGLVWQFNLSFAKDLRLAQQAHAQTQTLGLICLKTLKFVLSLSHRHTQRNTNVTTAQICILYIIGQWFSTSIVSTIFQP